nr:MAG TPA: hypothetical protein [Caudoviricetes sp.]
MHRCETIRTKHVRIHQTITPRGFKGIAIPLARLSPLSFAVQRKMEPSETVGKAARSVKS